MKEITEFQGPYRFLSNFGPGQVKINALVYPAGEHAYQALKSLDPAVRTRFTAPGVTAGQAKRLGQQVALRADWEQQKKRAMLRVVLAKFIQNPELAQQLFATEDAYLKEGNTWHDNYWGACRCERHAGAGLNYLGRILMAVRDVLRPD
jgi:ribA/ribD-fused uncharacterized protein